PLSRHHQYDEALTLRIELGRRFNMGMPVMHGALRLIEFLQRLRKRAFTSGDQFPFLRRFSVGPAELELEQFRLLQATFHASTVISESCCPAPMHSASRMLCNARVRTGSRQMSPLRISVAALNRRHAVFPSWTNSGCLGSRHSLSSAGMSLRFSTPRS